MSKRNVLGKGLGALIPEQKTGTGDRLRTIGIEEIVPNPYQPRQKFEAEKLETLAENIKEKGILQPLLVQRQGENYELIAGERRWRAAQLAGLKKVPVLVQENVTEIDSLSLALIENIHRKDLNPIEEAAAYNLLMKEFNLTQEEVSKIIGKDRATVANTVRLLNLPEEVQEMVSLNEIAAGHAKAILALEDKSKITEIARTIKQKGLSVRSTETLVNKILKEGESRKPVKSADPHIKKLQDELSRNFGTKVHIKTGRKKGKVEIEFYNPDDLQRIVDLLIGTVD